MPASRRRVRCCRRRKRIKKTAAGDGKIRKEEEGRPGTGPSVHSKASHCSPETREEEASKGMVIDPSVRVVVEAAAAAAAGEHGTSGVARWPLDSAAT